MKDTNIKERKVKYKGELDLAGFKLPCYVLEDGTRVLSSSKMQDVLRMVDDSKQKRGPRLKEYLGQKSLKPFVDRERKGGRFDPIICYDGGVKINGFEATVLPDICYVYLEAKKCINLSPRQTIIADQCEILVKAFAKVGILGLVDEATGYQKVREETLQAILKLYISEEILE